MLILPPVTVAFTKHRFPIRIVIEFIVVGNDNIAAEIKQQMAPEKSDPVLLRHCIALLSYDVHSGE